MVKVIKPSEVMKAGLMQSLEIVGMIVRLHKRTIVRSDSGEGKGGQQMRAGKGQAKGKGKAKGKDNQEFANAVLEIYIAAGKLPSDVILLEVWDFNRM